MGKRIPHLTEIAELGGSAVQSNPIKWVSWVSNWTHSSIAARVHRSRPIRVPDCGEAQEVHLRTAKEGVKASSSNWFPPCGLQPRIRAATAPPAPARSPGTAPTNGRCSWLLFVPTRAGHRAARPTPFSAHPSHGRARTVACKCAPRRPPSLAPCRARRLTARGQPPRLRTSPSRFP